MSGPVGRKGYCYSRRVLQYFRAQSHRDNTDAKGYFRKQEYSFSDSYKREYKQMALHSQSTALLVTVDVLSFHHRSQAM